MSDTVTAEPDSSTTPPGPTVRASAPVAPSGWRAKRKARFRRRRARFGITAVDRVNRCVLALLGVLLVAAGVVALLAEDDLELRQPSRLYQDTVRNILDERVPSFAIVLVVAVILVLAGLRWAWGQVSPTSGDGRIGTTTVDQSTKGVTTLEPVSAAKALSSDLETVEGVTRAGVRVISIGSRPDLIATIDVRRDVDLREVRRDAEEPLGRFLAATGSQDLEAELRFRIVGEEGPRVV